eukprot:5244293-Pleurochrysis_carterae.AAC.1
MQKFLRRGLSAPEFCMQARGRGVSLRRRAARGSASQRCMHGVSSASAIVLTRSHLRSSCIQVCRGPNVKMCM